jgi:hypothetical protein
MGVSSRWTGQRGRRGRRRLSSASGSGGGGGGVAGRSSWLHVEASALATSVAVMAPALTEGGPQKPENLLPALPAGGFLSAEQAKQVCHSANSRTTRTPLASHDPTVRSSSLQHLISFIASICCASVCACARVGGSSGS